MKPTTVLCAGMFRSGSTWAYNVARDVIRRSDPRTPIDAGYLEGDDLVAAIRVPGPTHRIYKFHLGTPAILAAIRDGSVDAVVHSRRDPMTALASCVDQFCSRPVFAGYWTFEKAVEHVVDGLRLGRELASCPNVVTIDLHEQGEAECLDEIVRLLDVELTVEQRDHVRQEFTFDAMRMRASEISRTPSELLFRGINDPETLMHAGHVDKGVAHDWSAELTADQVEHAERAFASEFAAAAHRAA